MKELKEQLQKSIREVPKFDKLQSHIDMTAHLADRAISGETSRAPASERRGCIRRETRAARREARTHGRKRTCCAEEGIELASGYRQLSG
jgi:hypothetical protein